MFASPWARRSAATRCFCMRLLLLGCRPLLLWCGLRPGLLHTGWWLLGALLLGLSALLLWGGSLLLCLCPLLRRLSLLLAPL